MTLDKNTHLLFVSRPPFSHIDVYDTQKGTHVATFGKLGESPGDFNKPGGLAIHDGKLFVADYANTRVQVTDEQGTLQKVIRIPDGYFRGITGFDVAPDGVVWLADGPDDRVCRFGPDMTPLGCTGALGLRDGLDPYGFRGLESIAISPTGDVYISESGYNRIGIYDNNFSFKKFVTGIHGVLKFDPKGHLWVKEGQTLKQLDDQWNVTRSVEKVDSFCFTKDSMITCYGATQQITVHSKDNLTKTYKFNNLHLSYSAGCAALPDNRVIFAGYHPEQSVIFDPDNGNTRVISLMVDGMVLRNVNSLVYRNGIWTALYYPGSSSGTSQLLGLKPTDADVINSTMPYNASGGEAKTLPIESGPFTENGLFNYRVDVRDAGGELLGQNEQVFKVTDLACKITAAPTRPIFLKYQPARFDISVDMPKPIPGARIEVWPQATNGGWDSTSDVQTNGDIPQGHSTYTYEYKYRPQNTDALLRFGVVANSRLLCSVTTTYRINNDPLDCEVNYPKSGITSDYYVDVTCFNHLDSDLDLSAEFLSSTTGYNVSKDFTLPAQGSASVVLGPIDQCRNSEDIDVTVRAKCESCSWWYDGLFRQSIHPHCGYRLGFQADPDGPTAIQGIDSMVTVAVTNQDDVGGTVSVDYFLSSNSYTPDGNFQLYLDPKGTRKVQIPVGVPMYSGGHFLSLQEFYNQSVIEIVDTYYTISKGVDLGELVIACPKPGNGNTTGVIVKCPNNGVLPFQGGLAVTLSGAAEDSGMHQVLQETIPVMIPAHGKLNMNIPVASLLPGSTDEHFQIEIDLKDAQGKYMDGENCDFSVPQQIVSVHAPKQLVLTPGQKQDVGITMDNNGLQPVALMVTSKVLGAQTQDVVVLAPGESKDYTVPVQPALTLPVVEGFAEFHITAGDSNVLVKPSKVSVGLVIAGVNLSADLVLDQPAYNKDDQAVLSITLHNPGPAIPMALTVRHGDFSTTQAVAGQDGETTTIPFKVQNPEGKVDVEFTEPDSGAHLLLDYALLHRKDPMLEIRKLKPASQDTVNLSVRAAKNGEIKAECTALGFSFNQALQVDTPVSMNIPVPDGAPPGVYTLNYTFHYGDSGKSEGKFTFKVKKPGIMVYKLKLDSTQVMPGDNVELSFIVSTKVDSQAELRLYDLAAADGYWQKVGEQPLTIASGYNPIDVHFQAGSPAGTHTIKVVLMRGDVVAASAQRMFNVGGFAIRTLKVIPDSVKCGDSVKIALSLYHAKGPDVSMKVLQNNELLQNAVINKTGVINLSWPVKTTLPGKNTVQVELDIEGHDPPLKDQRLAGFNVTDTTPPAITVNCINNAVLYQPFELEFSASDKCGPATVTALLNGNPVSSPWIVDTPGSYLLHVKAVDSTGNTQVMNRSFVVLPGYQPQGDDAMDDAMDGTAEEKDVTETLYETGMDTLPDLHSKDEKQEVIHDVTKRPDTNSTHEGGSGCTLSTGSSSPAGPVVVLFFLVVLLLWKFRKSSG